MATGSSWPRSRLPRSASSCSPRVPAPEPKPSRRQELAPPRTTPVRGRGRLPALRSLVMSAHLALNLPPAAAERLRLTAYRLSPGARVEPAPRWRDWMNATHKRFANRCLPLLMANQSGWHITLEHPVRARWNGGTAKGDVVVESESPLAPKGHFGHGILTFHVSFLFRTDPGWNLLVRGRPNTTNDGSAPLEGAVESDCSPATFTMNWRFTRPCEASWDAGDPIAMVVPQ